MRKSAQGLRPFVAATTTAAASVATIAVFTPSVAHAAFADGQLVVVRVGNGITDTGNPNYIPFDASLKTQPVSLEVYNVTGDTPVHVGSYAVPSGSSDPSRLVLTSRGDDNDSKLTLSSNGQYLTLGGYQENLGVGVSSTNYVATGTAPRVIGRFDSEFNYTASVLPGGAYSGLSINAVASDDGQRFWVAGGNDTNDNGGLRFVPSVGAASVNVTTGLFGSQTDSYRGLRMVNGQLFANTPAQNSFNLNAPGGAKYRRGIYWMNVSGALPVSASPVASTATAIIASNDGSTTDAAGNNDTPDAKGEFYPKTDSVFLDLNHDGALDTAYGTGGKAEIQKWHYDTASATWKRNVAVDLVKIGALGADPLVDGDSELNALDAYVQGNTVNLFLSTDLGILRLQDFGGTGGIVNDTTITGTATATVSNRTFNATKYIGYTADDNYQFRGLVMVPEPTTGLAALCGVVGLLAGRRRRRFQR